MQSQIQPDRKFIVPVLAVLAFFAIFASIVLTLMVAHRQSYQEQRRKADLLAQSVLLHADSSSRDVTHALDRMERELPGAPPCSTAKMRLMGDILLGSSEISGAGYIAGDRLACTFAGPLEPALPVGPPDYKGAGGDIIRAHVALPMGEGTRYLLVSRPSGFAAIIHPHLSRDIVREDPRVTFGVFGRSKRSMVSLTGTFDWAMLRKYFDEGATSYVYDGKVVAVRSSTEGDFAAFAILPTRSVGEVTRQYALYLLIIAGVIAFVLAAALAYIVKSQYSVRSILRAAIRGREFRVEYQPIVELATGRWIGAEALLRWRRRDGQAVRPDIFIAAAEESGLIGELTEMLFDLIGRDLRDTLDDHADFYVSVNVAAADLQLDRLAPLLEGLVFATGLAPSRIMIEATERGLIDAAGGRVTLDAIRQCGFRVALDDFGTGYSSLSYLQTFALDVLKIDKLFVDSVRTDAATSNVVSHIINMARDLDIEMVAEGVETETQARFLERKGVRFAQGWLFARSMPWPDLIAVLAKRDRTAEAA